MLPVITFIYGIFTMQGAVFLNSIYTILCVASFIIIHKKFPILSKQTYCAAIIFILLSMLAGRGFDFYTRILYWDKILHFSSGFIFASAGTQIYKKLKGDDKNHTLMNLFILSFSVSLACLWEIYEFSIDNFFGTAAQNDSLSDTMWDMIMGTVSVVTVILYNILILKKNSRH